MLSPRVSNDCCQLELAIYSAHLPQVAQVLMTLPDNALTDQQRAMLVRLGQLFRGNGVRLDSDNFEPTWGCTQGDGEESSFASFKASKRGPGRPLNTSGKPPPIARQKRLIGRYNLSLEHYTVWRSLTRVLRSQADKEAG